MYSPERMRQGTKMLTLEVDLPQTKSYQNICHLTFVVIFLAFSSFYYGFCLAYLSSVQSETLVKQFGTQAGKPSIVGGLIGGLPIGGAIGALSAPIFMRFFSRKNFLLIFNAVAIMIAGILQINNIILLFVCRVIQGFLVGNYMAITPIYINQLVPLQIQGSYGAFTQLFAVIGIVLCYLLGVIFVVTDINQGFVWRFLFSFNGLTTIVQSALLIFNFIPQSPVSLIQKGQIEQARKVLSKFNTAAVLDRVLQQTIAKVNANQFPKKNQIDMTLPAQNLQVSVIHPDVQEQRIILTGKALFLAFELPFMQQMSGINTVITQIGSIVQEYDQSLGLYAPLISNSVQLAATFVSVVLLAYFGRRFILLSGSLLLAIINIVIGVMFLILPSWPPAIYVALAFIVLFMFGFGASIGPAVWLYVPEIVPANYVPPATFMNWLGCTLTIVLPPFVIQAAGTPYPVFLFFGGVSVLMFVLNYFIVVQTKGLSAVQVSKKFKS